MDLTTLLGGFLIGLVIFGFVSKSLFRKDNDQPEAHEEKPESSSKDTTTDAESSLDKSHDDFDNEKSPTQTPALNNKVPPVYQPPSLPGEFMDRKEDMQEILNNTDQSGTIFTEQGGIEGVGRIRGNSVMFLEQTDFVTDIGNSEIEYV